MYRMKKPPVAVLVGDRATVPVFELISMVSDFQSFKFEDPQFATAENPRGVRIVNQRGYALELAAAAAQDGRMG